MGRAKPKRKASSASTELTLGDLEDQIREVAEATSLADTHLDVKKGELRLKCLRSLVELVSQREAIRTADELVAKAAHLEDLLGRQEGGAMRVGDPGDVPFVMPDGSPVPVGSARWPAEDLDS